MFIVRKVAVSKSKETTKKLSYLAVVGIWHPLIRCFLVSGQFASSL